MSRESSSLTRRRARWAPRRAPLIALLAVAALGVGLVPAPAGSVPPPSAAVAAAADSAVAWLLTQQQADGGFEVYATPGFETPDAVLAIAEAAQTTGTWSTAEALSAVLALTYGGPSGPTPIDALDDWVTSGIGPGEASKLIVLVVAPLGLDPTSFGPSTTNLAQIVYPTGCGGGPDLSSVFYYESLNVGLAGRLLCGTVPATVLAGVRAGQRPDGSWSFTGNPADPSNNGDEVDVTSWSLQVLLASGAGWNDPAVTAGLRWLVAQQTASGGFQAFGDPDPNATAMAMIAITAAGFDPSSSCWRDTAEPALAGTPYADPLVWGLGQQEPDGRVASPFDTYGVNTFPTSQSVEGWLRLWLPIVRATGAPDCAPPPAPDPVLPRFTG